jgi:DNA-binding LacI/PurR family transcriptional regulator
MKMDDIARLAGVSKSAVSLALGGKPGIGSETRDRIIQIAKENGYVIKSRSGKLESSPKSLTFLVLSNSSIIMERYYQQPFFRELIHFIEERCRAHGFSLVFAAIELENYEKDIAQFVEERQTDGVILLGTNLDQAQVEELAGLIPHLVVLDTCFETLPVHFVEINNFMGAYQAGTYLCQSGHRSIGYLASNVRIHNFNERKRGFKAALQQYGQAGGVQAEFHVSPTTMTSQAELKQQIEAYLRSGKELPTAFYCECDYIAISTIKTLSEMGYRIPEDISVIGFDNINESQIVTPELTTVHVEKERMAQLAVELLIDSIGSNSTKTKCKVDTVLVPRMSCRPV